MNDVSVEAASSETLIEELQNRIEHKNKEIKRLRRVEQNAHVIIRKEGSEGESIRLSEGGSVIIDPGIGIYFQKRTFEKSNEENE